MYLGLKEESLLSSGAIHTAREISGQPELWKKVALGIKDHQSDITSFLDKCLSEVDNIILTGAGTSSYIGISLQGLFFRKFKKNVLAVPTTDLVTHPENYFRRDKPVLLVSFARSGNSPESVAAVKLADEFSSKCFHLIITCNPEGSLALQQVKHIKNLILLPPESDDKGLAMTGSYSGMLLAGILLAWIHELNNILSRIELLSEYGDRIIKEYGPSLEQIAQKPFERAVFLGSGPFYGTASESHLKVQELTDGHIVCKRDSFLGFRHGPKAVVHDNTLMVYIFSKNRYSLLYEKDMAIAIAKEHNPVAQIAIFESNDMNLRFDLPVRLSVHEQLPAVLLTVCNILPAQILGFYKSLDLGLQPDSPSVNKVISRVVEGVKIYDFQ